MTDPLHFSAASVCIVTGALINLEVQGGEIHCISGASGGGKTRLLRAFADLDAVEGQISLDGQSHQAMPPTAWRQQVMLNPAQPRWWQATLAAHCTGDISDWAQQLYLNPDRLNAPIEELSTGEQARGGLLRSLSRAPRLLLLDEPTGALDADSTRAVEALLQDWLNPQRALIWVSHDRDQIARLQARHWRLDHQGLHAA